MMGQTLYQGPAFRRESPFELFDDCLLALRVGHGGGYESDGNSGTRPDVFPLTFIGYPARKLAPGESFKRNPAPVPTGYRREAVEILDPLGDPEET